MKKKNMYSELVVRSLELGAMWHEGQWRRHPEERIPYIAHPAGVGMMLLRAGHDDEVVAAGILHDVIEDCGVTIESLAAATTQRVADLVSWVTEPPKKMSWSDRKEHYFRRLLDAPPEALDIACADHAYNLHSLSRVTAVYPEAWDLFHAGKEEKLMRERALFESISSRHKSPLVETYRKALEAFAESPL